MKWKAAPTLGNTRLVTANKLAGSRVYVGVYARRDGSVAVDSVSEASPLSGLVFPGDLVRGMVGLRKVSAQTLPAALRAASTLELQVETPAHLDGAQSIFLINSADVENTENVGAVSGIGLDLDRDPTTGLGRVASIAPHSIAATTSLQVGDLVVAVGVGGTLQEAETVKEATAKLHEASAEPGGVIEVRLVHDPTPVAVPADAGSRSSQFSSVLSHRLYCDPA